jgi:hypothetical protein
MNLEQVINSDQVVIDTLSFLTYPGKALFYTDATTSLLRKSLLMHMGYDVLCYNFRLRYYLLEEISSLHK